MKENCENFCSGALNDAANDKYAGDEESFYNDNASEVDPEVTMSSKRDGQVDDYSIVVKRFQFEKAKDTNTPRRITPSLKVVSSAEFTDF